MFAFLRRTREMFPRSRELAYELVTLQKNIVLLFFFFPSLIIHLLNLSSLAGEM